MVILSNCRQIIYREVVVEIVLLAAKHLIQKHSRIVHVRYMAINTITVKSVINAAKPT